MPANIVTRISRDLEAAFPGSVVFVEEIAPPFAKIEIRDLDTLPDRLREAREIFDNPRYTPEQVRAFVAFHQLKGAYVVSLHVVPIPIPGGVLDV